MHFWAVMEQVLCILQRLAYVLSGVMPAYIRALQLRVVLVALLVKSHE